MKVTESDYGFHVSCPKCGQSFPLKYQQLAAIFGLGTVDPVKLAASVFCVCSLPDASESDAELISMAKHVLENSS